LLDLYGRNPHVYIPNTSSRENFQSKFIRSYSSGRGRICSHAVETYRRGPLLFRHAELPSPHRKWKSSWRSLSIWIRSKKKPNTSPASTSGSSPRWGAVGGSRSRPSRCPTECLHCLLILVRVIGIRRSVSVRVAWIQQSIIIKRGGSVSLDNRKRFLSVKLLESHFLQNDIIGDIIRWTGRKSIQNYQTPDQ